MYLGQYRPVHRVQHYVALRYTMSEISSDFIDQYIDKGPKWGKWQMLIHST